MLFFFILFYLFFFFERSVVQFSWRFLASLMDALSDSVSLSFALSPLLLSARHLSISVAINTDAHASIFVEILFVPRSPLKLSLSKLSLRFSRKDYYFDSSSILRSRFAWFIDTNIFGGKNIGDTMAAIPITHGRTCDLVVVIVRTRATSTRKKANLVWAKNYFSSHEGNFRDGSFFDFYFYFTLYSLMIFLSVWLKIIRIIKSLIFFFFL